MKLDLDVFRQPENSIKRDLKAIARPGSYGYGAHPPVWPRKPPTGFTLSFRIPAGGKGETRLHAWIGPKHFAQIAALMMENSADAAEKAFLSAMLKRRRRRDKKT